MNNIIKSRHNCAWVEKRSLNAPECIPLDLIQVKVLLSCFVFYLHCYIIFIIHLLYCIYNVLYCIVCLFIIINIILLLIIESRFYIIMQVVSSGSVPSCPVCRRTIAVTAAGLLRQHGPVSARCPGSRQPPAAPIDVSSQPVNSAPSYSASTGHEANFDDEAATPHTPPPSPKGPRENP